LLLDSVGHPQLDDPTFLDDEDDEVEVEDEDVVAPDPEPAAETEIEEDEDPVEVLNPVELAVEPAELAVEPVALEFDGEIEPDVLALAIERESEIRDLYPKDYRLRHVNFYFDDKIALISRCQEYPPDHKKVPKSMKRSKKSK
jgi:hypothetical protein